MGDNKPDLVLPEGSEEAAPAPEINFVPGHTLTRKYRYLGDHIVMTVGGESFNVGFRPKRRQYRTDTSKYQPHQGAKECARRKTHGGCML